MACWAAQLGGCSDKLSREHLVTDGLWTGPDVTVQGLPWCKTKPVRVGRASVVSKILCTVHNSGLSPLDTAAIGAFKALGGAVALQERRRRAFSEPLIQQCFGVDGHLLERWFLKTAINLALVQQGAVRWADGSVGREPPIELVSAAFGRGALPLGAGLYAAASVGEAGLSDESVHFAPLFDQHDLLSGGIFRFRGFRFLLSLREGLLPRSVSLGSEADDPWRNSDLVFHIQRFRFAVGSTLSHFVYFEWPGRVSAHFYDEPQHPPRAL